MVKPAIQVTVVYDSKSKSGGCDADCGIDWSSTEAISLINQRIKERFSDRIESEYLDLSEPGSDRRILELKLTTSNENLLLPLLVINGQLRISGQFDIHPLLDAVDAEIEIKQK